MKRDDAEREMTPEEERQFVALLRSFEIPDAGDYDSVPEDVIVRYFSGSVSDAEREMVEEGMSQSKAFFDKMFLMGSALQEFESSGGPERFREVAERVLSAPASDAGRSSDSVSRPDWRRLLHGGLVEQIIEEISRAMRSGKFQDAARRVRSLPTKVPVIAEIAESLRSYVGLGQLLGDREAAGPVIGVHPAAVPLPATRASGIWREEEGLRSIEDEIHIRNLWSEGQDIANYPDLVLDLAAVLTTLDQFDRAELTLESIPESARRDWSYRYVRGVLRVRRAAYEQAPQSKHVELFRNLEQLLEEAREDELLESRVPELLFNLAEAADRQPARAVADRYRAEALAHPAIDRELAERIREIERLLGRD